MAGPSLAQGTAGRSRAVSAVSRPWALGECGRLLLSGWLLLTFLSAALLGQVLFALVKWELS